MAVTITPCVAVHKDSLRKIYGREFALWMKISLFAKFMDETAIVMENEKSIAKIIRKIIKTTMRTKNEK
jgi:hypothetical protein